MFICEKCREMVDPASTDVITLEHWRNRPATSEGPEQLVKGIEARFHRRHAPKPGLEWRVPSVRDSMVESAPGQDAPFPLDEP
jgi:hypothetical protein